MEPAIWAAEDWPVQHTRGSYHAWNSVAFDASHGGVRCSASKQSVVRAVRRGDPSDSIRSSRCKTLKRRDRCWSDRAGRAARCGIRPSGEGRCAAAGRRHSFRDRFGNESFHVVAAGRHGKRTTDIRDFPEGERDYFYKVINAQFTFATNSRGKATELILHQNGLDQHAKQTE